MVFSNQVNTYTELNWKSLENKGIYHTEQLSIKGLYNRITELTLHPKKWIFGSKQYINQPEILFNAGIKLPQEISAYDKIKAVNYFANFSNNLT